MSSDKITNLFENLAKKNSFKSYDENIVKIILEYKQGIEYYENVYLKNLELMKFVFKGIYNKIERNSQIFSNFIFEHKDNYLEIENEFGNNIYRHHIKIYYENLNDFKVDLKNYDIFDNIIYIKFEDDGGYYMSRYDLEKKIYYKPPIEIQSYDFYSYA